MVSIWFEMRVFSLRSDEVSSLWLSDSMQNKGENIILFQYFLSGENCAMVNKPPIVSGESRHAC